MIGGKQQNVGSCPFPPSISQEKIHNYELGTRTEQRKKSVPDLHVKVAFPIESVDLVDF
jgi:hypothetical protein